MFKLENQHLVVSAKMEGAELTSILSKADNTEYLWQGDIEYWGRHAPILFPIVGKLVDNKYILDGKTFTMGQHGFARDMDFEIVSQTEEKLSFVLHSTEETLVKYPYPFTLLVKYTLEGNSVRVTYKVINTGNSTLYFSIGAHPAFNWPFTPSENQTDYYLEFEQMETLHSLILKDGVISNDTKPVLENANTIPLAKELFNDDALILKDFTSENVSIKSKASNQSVTVQYKGFPYLGIWSKPDGAPFVCIEPWYGIADTQNSTGILKEKEGIQKLELGMEFVCEYIITIG